MKTENRTVEKKGICQHTFVAIGVFGLIKSLFCTCKSQSLTDKGIVYLTPTATSVGTLYDTLELHKPPKKNRQKREVKRQTNANASQN
jgi:hypothetical protein